MAGGIQSTESNHWAFSTLNGGGLWDQHVGAHFGVTASTHLSNQPHHSHWPRPVAPVGQLALALLGSGPISGIMLFAFDKSHRKEKEKGARGREGRIGQEGGHSRVSRPSAFPMAF